MILRMMIRRRHRWMEHRTGYYRCLDIYINNKQQITHERCVCVGYTRYIRVCVFWVEQD